MDRLLCFGASITWGANDTTGGWVQQLRKYISTHSADREPSVYNLGVSGDTTTHLLDRFEHEYAARQKPETGVLFLIGTNDAQYNNDSEEHWISEDRFRENITKLCERATEQATYTGFIALPPVDDRVDPIPWKPTHSYRQNDINRYNSILEEQCAQHEVDYIRTPERFSTDLLADGVHPGPVGHVLLGETVIRHLSEENILPTPD